MPTTQLSSFYDDDDDDDDDHYDDEEDDDDHEDDDDDEGHEDHDHDKMALKATSICLLTTQLSSFHEIVKNNYVSSSTFIQC